MPSPTTPNRYNPHHQPFRRRTNTPVLFNRAHCLRETERALYIVIAEIPGRRAEWRGWIPQSQIHDDSEVWREKDVGKLVLTRWIAEQKGLA